LNDGTSLDRRHGHGNKNRRRDWPAGGLAFLSVCAI
jgi:hypothetical protein